MGAFSAQDLRRISEESDSQDSTRVNMSPERELQHAARMRLAETLVKKGARRAASPIVLVGIVRMLEAGIVVMAGVATRLAYIHRPIQMAEILALISVSLFMLLAFQALGLNRVSAYREPIYQGFRLLGGWSMVFFVALGAAFFAKLDFAFSRGWLLSWWAAGLIALLGERAILAMIVRKMTERGQLERRTVIVGGGPQGEEILHALSAQKNTDIRICGVFDERTDDRSPLVVAGYPKLGNIDDLVDFARHTRVDLVIFTLPITAEARLLQMLRKLWVLPIDIRLSAHANKLRLRPRSYSWIGDIPVLDVFDKPIADWDVVIKSAFDRIVGALCLLLASPIMAIVALAVKLDSSGPILFKQLRHGFNNEPIHIYKFRSMYADKSDYAAAKQVTRHDPRVTRVGRFIRKTSLDELPQLFNVVFQGNLSLVGPRPHAVAARAAEYTYETVVDGYFARHRVRPGLTGWAQINGWRGETDTEEKILRRVEYDLFYIENWSIWFDIYILLRTPFALLKAENAY